VPLSLREHFVIDCLERMKTVQIANGFETDIVTVDEWRMVPFTKAELPALVLRDGDCRHETGNKSTKMQTNHLKMQIEAVVPPGQFAAAMARKLISDIGGILAIDREWSGRATDTTMDKSAIAISQDEQRVAGAVVEFTIHFGSVVFDAYE